MKPKNHENNKIQSPIIARLAEVWLEDKKLHTKESTYRLYAYLWDHYLSPNFGEYHPQDLTGAVMQNFFLPLSSLSISTKRSLAMVLRSIVRFGKFALQYDAIPPMKPSLATAQTRWISDDDWKHLLTAISQDMSLTASGIAIAACMGLRIGEICALRREDIDLGAKVLHVNHTVQRVMCKEDGKKSKVIIQTPKTSSSQRMIPIPKILLSRFEILCGSKAKEDYLLTSNGKMIEPRTMQYRFKKFLSAHCLPNLHFHQLRHKFATLCVENQVDLKTLSEILGHSSTAITMNYYVHPSMDYKRAQLDRIFVFP